MKPVANDTWTVIASGPSLTEDDVAHCRGRTKVMVVNDNYRLAPWADALFAADAQWWHAHAKAVSGIPLRATINGTAARLYGATCFLPVGDGGLVTGKGRLSEGRNSGHYAVHWAYRLGATRILLLGFDFAHTGGKAHWFGDHPHGWRNAEGIDDWLVRFRRLAHDLQRRGVALINCSRHTAIDCVPRQRLRDVLP